MTKFGSLMKWSHDYYRIWHFHTLWWSVNYKSTTTSKHGHAIHISSNNKNNQAWCAVLWSFLKNKQSKKLFFLHFNKEKKNVFECFHNDTEKYWKYQYISIYFLILGIDIDIRIFPVKKYNIDIWRIKRYFTVPKYWFTEHWSKLHPRISIVV